MNLKELVSKKNLAVFLLALGLTGGVLYYFKDQFIVARVNGQPIFRLALIKELEKQFGEETLNVLITQALIWQEAEKQGVAVSNEEVDQEIKQIEGELAAQGQDLNQVLGLQSMTQDELKGQIRIQKLAEELVKKDAKDLEVTDEEVENYFTENRDSFPEDVDAEEAKTDIRQQLEQQKLNQGIGSWVEALRNNAEINYLKKF